MRILAHIHTFNDADIIDGTIDGVRRQTRPVDEILVVDNASTDGTLDRPSIKHVTVLSQTLNGGTSGAVHNGMRYALEHGYDWIWLFDADSYPEPDALEKLLELYGDLPEAVQKQTAFLACVHANVQDGELRHAGLFTEAGIAEANPDPKTRYYACHFTIWSGCLYRLDAVRDIGLPNADYVLDWGEGEYGYRVMRAGYKGFADQKAMLHHNVRGCLSFNRIPVKLGPAEFTVYEFSPHRCYYGAAIWSISCSMRSPDGSRSCAAHDRHGNAADCRLYAAAAKSSQTLAGLHSRFLARLDRQHCGRY